MDHSKSHIQYSSVEVGASNHNRCLNAAFSLVRSHKAGNEEVDTDKLIDAGYGLALIAAALAWARTASPAAATVAPIQLEETIIGLSDTLIALIRTLDRLVEVAEDLSGRTDDVENTARYEAYMRAASLHTQQAYNVLTSPFGPKYQGPWDDGTGASAGTAPAE